MDKERNEALVRRYYDEVLGQGKLELVDEMIASDYVNHDPTNPPDLSRGPAGVKQFVSAFHQAFPDGRLTLEQCIVAEQHVTVIWHWQGTHRGEFFGIAPTGHRVEVGGMSLLRLDGGRIAEQWDYWDAFGLMQQLQPAEAVKPGAVTYIPGSATTKQSQT